MGINWAILVAFPFRAGRKPWAYLRQPLPAGQYQTLPPDHSLSFQEQNQVKVHPTTDVDIISIVLTVKVKLNPRVETMVVDLTCLL